MLKWIFMLQIFSMGYIMEKISIRIYVFGIMTESENRKSIRDHRVEMI